MDVFEKYQNHQKQKKLGRNKNQKLQLQNITLFLNTYLQKKYQGKNIKHFPNHGIGTEGNIILQSTNFLLLHSYQTSSLHLPPSLIEVQASEPLTDPPEPVLIDLA